MRNDEGNGRRLLGLGAAVVEGAYFGDEERQESQLSGPRVVSEDDKP